MKFPENASNFRIAWSGRLWVISPLPQGGSSSPGTEGLALRALDSSLAPDPLGSHWVSEGLTGSPFPLAGRRAEGGGRAEGRSLAHRRAVLFSWRLWERKLGGLLRAWNCTLHKTTTPRGAARRARLHKSLGGGWQGLLAAPAQRPGPLGEEAGRLSTPASRGEGLGKAFSGVPSSTQWAPPPASPPGLFLLLELVLF